jgi:hypothetical protein
MNPAWRFYGCKARLSKLTTTGFSSTLADRILDTRIRIPCGCDKGSQLFGIFAAG